MMDRMKRCTLGLKRIWKDLLQNKIAGAYICPIKIRVILLNVLGNCIEDDCYFSPKAFLGWGSGRLIVGKNSFINYNVFFDLGADIVIGSNVNIAMNVKFINSTHSIGNKYKRAGEKKEKNIMVGDGTWIGADSLIMPGVKIGRGVIIGAGSLVLEDCQDNCIYAGRPAKLKRRIVDNE